MRPPLFIFTLLGLLFSCVNEKESNEGIVLTLPFGKYNNWVYWEMKQMNFRIKDNELLIDTTYDLKPTDFKAHHFERLEDYPEIAKFLKKPVTELHDLQNAVSMISCDNRHQFWIQYDDGTKLDTIWTDDCESTHHETFSSVYQEMEKLKDKYKP